MRFYNPSSKNQVGIFTYYFFCKNESDSENNIMCHIHTHTHAYSYACIPYMRKQNNTDMYILHLCMCVCLNLPRFSEQSLDYYIKWKLYNELFHQFYFSPWVQLNKILNICG